MFLYNIFTTFFTLTFNSCEEDGEATYQKYLKDIPKYYFILRKDYCIDGVKDFIFYTKSGTLINTCTFNRELKAAVEKYNETAEHKIETISAHTLRHTGCTRDAEDGMDIKVLQYIMGHSNTQITNNIYNHVNEERAVTEVMNVAEKRRNRAYVNPPWLKKFKKC